MLKKNIIFHKVSIAAAAPYSPSPQLLSFSSFLFKHPLQKSHICSDWSAGKLLGLANRLVYACRKCHASYHNWTSVTRGYLSSWTHHCSYSNNGVSYSKRICPKHSVSSTWRYLQQVSSQLAWVCQTTALCKGVPDKPYGVQGDTAMEQNHHHFRYSV